MTDPDRRVPSLTPPQGQGQGEGQTAPPQRQRGDASLCLRVLRRGRVHEGCGGLWGEPRPGGPPLPHLRHAQAGGQTHHPADQPDGGVPVHHPASHPRPPVRGL